MKKLIFSAAILASLFGCSKSTPTISTNLRVTGDHVMVNPGEVDADSLYVTVRQFKTRFYFEFTRENKGYTPTDSTVASVKYQGATYLLSIPANEASGYLIPRGTVTSDTTANSPVVVMYAYNKDFSIIY